MKKIMFNDRYGLTQAVLDGRKTQTRRICACEDKITELKEYNPIEKTMSHGRYIVYYNSKLYLLPKPKYKLGEVFAVAQRYKDVAAGGCPVDSRYDAFRMENWDEDKREPGRLKTHKGWSNKMFVKPDLMPHQIKMTGIRVERLQDISNEDCIREGVQYIGSVDKYYFEEVKRKPGFYFRTPREAFAVLIDKVCGKGTWAGNPYVFVYEFELVK